MSNLSSSLTLCLGALSFLTMRRGLGAQVTLHLPSRRSHIFLRPRASDPIRIPDMRRVTIGNNTYIITQIPSSSIPSSSNVHPPPHSRGPSGRNVATSYVRTAVTRPVVSQLHALPIVLGGQVHTSRGHIPTFRMYIPMSGVYVPTYRVSHGTSNVMTYGPYCGTQYR